MNRDGEGTYRWLYNQYHAKGLESDPIEIDFTPPFRFGSFSGLSCFGLVYKALRYLCVASADGLIW